MLKTTVERLVSQLAMMSPPPFKPLVYLYRNFLFKISTVFYNLPGSLMYMVSTLIDYVVPKIPEALTELTYTIAV